MTQCDDSVPLPECKQASGSRGVLPRVNFYNLDPLKSPKMRKLLVIPSKFPELCTTIFRKRLDNIFISQVILVEDNY